MKTIKLSQDIEHEGLVAGDVLSVDDNSAAALIRSGRAEEYDPQKAPAADTTNVVPEPEVTTYGNQEGVRTIDDIRDPEAARNRRVMSFATVAAADHGPVAAEPTAATDVEPEAEAVDGAGATHTGTLPTSASNAGEPADAPAEADTSKATRPKPGRPGSTTTTSAQAAPDAKSAGGDAGGGNS
ncbi:hypothetical protein A5721_18950 [Mycobacterium vulneris]|nr:hypothetical protein A5721_18950 [Mycolicibacterium vulneris]